MRRREQPVADLAAFQRETLGALAAEHTAPGVRTAAVPAPKIALSMAETREELLWWAERAGPLDVYLGPYEIGYGMRRTDDCLRAAIATATQIPISELPDPRLDERLRAGDDVSQISSEALAQLVRCLDEHRLELAFHREVPLELDRWVAVLSASSGRPFMDHCLVMSHSRKIFDPAWGCKPPPGMRPRRWFADMIVYGISFDRKGLR